jgi:hypothetical protein
MSALDDLKNRLHAQADLNGDKKVNKADIEWLFTKAADEFKSDVVANTGWVLVGFGLGALTVLILRYV